MLETYRAQAGRAMEELLRAARCRNGELVVVGCSTSEVGGSRIGSAGSPEIAAALLAGLLPPLRQAGLFLAAQCCEHLNRALVVEREAAEAFGLARVNALPRPAAGGSFATAAWQAMETPWAVERVEAAAGLDVGGTFIGMHLRRVAVPVRLAVRAVGEAPVAAARTRPPYVGGERTAYEDALR